MFAEQGGPARGRLQPGCCRGAGGGRPGTPGSEGCLCCGCSGLSSQRGGCPCPRGGRSPSPPLRASPWAGPTGVLGEASLAALPRPAEVRGCPENKPRAGGRWEGGSWMSSEMQTWQDRCQGARWYPAWCQGPSSGLCRSPGSCGTRCVPGSDAGMCWEPAAPEQVLRGRSPLPRSAQPRSAGGSVPAAPAGDHESPVTRGQGAAGDLIANGGAMTPGAASDPTFNS